MMRCARPLHNCVETLCFAAAVCRFSELIALVLAEIVTNFSSSKHSCAALAQAAAATATDATVHCAQRGVGRSEGYIGKLSSLEYIVILANHKLKWMKKVNSAVYIASTISKST